MKTITLSEEAYERLKSWKETPKESFSAVVIKKVPKRGTAGQLNEDFKNLSPLTDEQARVMEETVAWANDWKNLRDPWAEGQQEAKSQKSEVRGRAGNEEVSNPGRAAAGRKKSAARGQKKSGG